MVKLVRDGKLVWPYCKECGCRLDVDVIEEKALIMHFGKGPKDPRGHECEFVNHPEFVPAENIYQGVV